MININIDGLNFIVKSQISILEACKYVGINIPKFCYHESLSVAGNCRMCLVELQKSPKPVASCAMPVMGNMTIFTSSPLVKKARENVLEALLINHPLDCPICDQGGECDLQDETQKFGIDFSRYYFKRREVEDKNCGLIIKTIMTRCIHCTRCVRFGSEIAGIDFFGTINRGTKTEISNYIPKIFNSHISGNVIDLCPVGALTSKNYAFKARPWELKIVENIDLSDGSGTSIYYHFKESEIVRVLPKVNSEINDNWISNKTRFSFDALRNSRLESIFYKVSGYFKKGNWKLLFDQFYQLNKISNQKTIYVIDHEVGLKSLIVLKKIVNKKYSILKTLNGVKNSSNFYETGLKNNFVDINDSQICFLLYSNIYVENTLINIKLRIKHVQKNFDIIGFGKVFNSIFPINFNNITTKNLTIFLESKLESVSHRFIFNKKPLVLIGENVYSSFSNFEFLVKSLKNIFYNSIVLNINLKSNTESIRMLNIKSVSNNDLKSALSSFFINIDDNFYSRKFYSYIEKKNSIFSFWFNTHGSEISKKFNTLVPITHGSEEEDIFINTEQRAQKTNILLTNKNGSKSLNNILVYNAQNSLNIPETTLKSNYILFINEYANSNNSFEKIKTFFTKKYSMFQRITPVYFSLYPNKYVVEDFYLSNTYCKNSLMMNRASIDYRMANKYSFLN